jgi:hypothetical protein
MLREVYMLRFFKEIDQKDAKSAAAQKDFAIKRQQARDSESARRAIGLLEEIPEQDRLSEDWKSLSQRYEVLSKEVGTLRKIGSWAGRTGPLREMAHRYYQESIICSVAGNVKASTHSLENQEIEEALEFYDAAKESMSRMEPATTATQAALIARAQSILSKNQRAIAQHFLKKGDEFYEGKAWGGFRSGQVCYRMALRFLVTMNNPAPEDKHLQAKCEKRIERDTLLQKALR